MVLKHNSHLSVEQAVVYKRKIYGKKAKERTRNVLNQMAERLIPEGADSFNKES